MESGGFPFADPQGLVVVLVILGALAIAGWLMLAPPLGQRRRLSNVNVDRVAPGHDQPGRYLAVADLNQPIQSPAGQRQQVVAGDTDERKQAEEELRLSEARFRNIFDHTAVGMAHVSPDGRFLRANRKLAAMLGHRPAELRHMTVEQVSVPEDLARELPYMQEVRAGRRNEYTLEKRYRRQDGSTFWAELTACAIRDEHKQIAYLVGVVVDIDARKQLEFQVHRSNQLYRTLSETNRAIARSRDLDELLGEACLVAVSQAAFPLAAVVRRGSAGSSPMVVASAGPEARTFVQDLLALQARQGTSLLAGLEDGLTGAVVVNDVETGPVCANARLACLRRGVRSYATFPLGTREPSVTRLVVFSTEAGFFADDILEQVANMAQDLSLAVDRFAERADHDRTGARLRDIAQRMASLVDIVPVSVCDIDADQRVLGVWNPTAERMFGRRRHEIIGRPLPIEFAGAEDEARFAAMHRTVIAGSPAVAIEIHCKRGDGAPLRLSVSACPASVDSRAAMLMVAEDVTSRCEAEAILCRSHDELEALVDERTGDLAAARQRAEEADRIKTAFLANMSQQLRTPLNSIIGFSSLLLSGGPGPINSEQAGQLSIVRDAGERLMALVEDVLDIARLQAGNAQFSCEPTPVRDMVLRIVDTLRPQAISRGLTLDAELGSCVVMAEPRRLEQVITNLVSNAIRHTQVGGVMIRCRTNNGVAEIAVEDSGPGIEIERQQDLFTPFSSLDRDSAQNSAGLGMAIARRLVEAMGGGIWIDSEPGRGSAFTVRLEAANA